MALDLPVAGEKPWDVKLNAALNDLDSRLENTQGVPAGGTTDQVLIKASGADYDAGWETFTSSGLLPNATTSASGIVELATDAEATTGTDTARAVTPHALAAALTAYTPSAATTSAAGISELATDAEAITGTDTVRTVTPHALNAALVAYNGMYVGVNAQTGTTYTIVLGDLGKLVTLSNTSAITVTLPQDSSVAIPVGGRIDFLGINTGLVTFAAGSGATANATPSLVTRARYSAATAIKTAANTWIVVGDLA